MIRALVFDFDGVLADSEPCHLAALQEVLSAIGIRVTRDQYYERYLGLDDEGLFRTLRQERNWEVDDRAIAALVDEKARVYDDIVATREVVYPGVAECVERLARSFPLGIASGALRHEIEKILTAVRLRHHFKFIVASGDTPNSKPHPDPYRRSAWLHGVPPDTCLAIEDSRWGIDSAKGADLKCVGITTTYPAGELASADRIIGSLSELTEDFIRAL